MYNNNKLVCFLFLSFASLGLFSSHCEAATLHTIIIADTLEGEVSYGTECSIDLMERQYKRVASYIDYQFQYAAFEGYETNRNNVLEYIQGLEIEEEDIVALFFLCMGGANQRK